MDIMDVLIANAGLLVIAIGQAMLMKIGAIDLSVGSTTALVCMSSACLIENLGVSPYIVILISILIGLIMGGGQGFLVAYVDLHPILVSFAGIFLARGITSIISTEVIVINNDTFLDWSKYIRVIVAIIITVLMILILKFTKLGKVLNAIKKKELVELEEGYTVQRLKLKVYLIAGVLMGIGGLLYCMNSCVGFVEQAKGLEFDAIISAMLGMGTVLGTFLGVLITGTINSFAELESAVSNGWSKILLVTLLLIVVLFRRLFVFYKKKNLDNK